MRRAKIPLHLNATLRAACEKHEFSIALGVVRLSPVYSRARKKALNVALRLAESPFDFRAAHQFTEPSSRLEHRVVVKWARSVEAEHELREVLDIARGLARSKRLERFILRKLRRFGYRDWWEVARDFFFSFFPTRARKLA